MHTKGSVYCTAMFISAYVLLMRTSRDHTQGWDDATALFTSSDTAPILSSGDNCLVLMDQLKGHSLATPSNNRFWLQQRSAVPI